MEWKNGIPKIVCLLYSKTCLCIKDTQYYVGFITEDFICTSVVCFIYITPFLFTKLSITLL